MYMVSRLLTWLNDLKQQGSGYILGCSALDGKKRPGLKMLSLSASGASATTCPEISMKPLLKEAAGMDPPFLLPSKGVPVGPISMGPYLLKYGPLLRRWFTMVLS